MISPAKYEGELGNEGAEPQAICTPCLLCLTCEACGACSWCDCVTTPLSDINKGAVVSWVDVASW